MVRKFYPRGLVMTYTGFSGEAAFIHAVASTIYYVALLRESVAETPCRCRSHSDLCTSSSSHFFNFFLIFLFANCKCKLDTCTVELS